MSRDRQKKRKQKSGLRRLWVGLATSLVVGFVAICVAWWLLSSLAAPVLVVQLVASNSGEKLAVHLVNASEHDVKVALGDVRSFLVPVPNADHEYVIHLRDVTKSGNDRYGMVILPQGGDIPIADVTRHLRIPPSGLPLLLTAVFFAEESPSREDGAWRGFVRSTPMAIRSL